MQISTLGRVALVSLGAAMTVGLGAGIASAEMIDPPATTQGPNIPTGSSGSDGMICWGLPSGDSQDCY